MRKSVGKELSVGYCRPPKHSQFKKGTSGNKKGRPKGRKNLATIFRKEMNKTVAISENGQHRMITKVEAAIRQVINRAAQGDPKALREVINIARELGDLKLPDPAQLPTTRAFTLRVFEKDLETGERVEVAPERSRP
jgi:Family of unknown function (DUF5681)